MAGDVIIEVPQSNTDDRALQAEVGRRVGDSVEDTLALSAAERPGEIERRVREMVTSGLNEVENRGS